MSRHRKITQDFKRSTVILILILANFISVSENAFAAADDSLDTSFGTAGKVTTAIGGAADEISSVILQSDGKIIAAGYSHNGSNGDYALVRYNTDGSLDTTFDTDGKVTTAFDNGNDFARAVVLQTDGKIVAVGDSANNAGNRNFSIVRYSADGSLDTSFDTDGKVTTAIGLGADVANSAILQSDGKIIAAGYYDNGINGNDFVLVRYNTNGSLDTSFDTDGKVSTTFGTGSDIAASVILQSDGKIIAAGYSNNGSNIDFALVRYNSDGSLDTSFDTDGKLTTAVGSGNEGIYSVILQSDGKIIAAGYSHNGSNNDFALVRYNSDGSLDTSFGTAGKVTTAVGAGAEEINSAILQSDGKIIAAGFSHNGSNNDFALVRYNSDGSLDTSFGTAGKVTTAVGAGAEEINSAILQSDGKIIAAGFSYNGSNNDFALVRYSITNAVAQDAAQAAAEAARVAAAQAEAARKAREQKELTEILALIPKIGELTLGLGEVTKSLTSTQCVKGKTTKTVKKGAKCPKGYVKR